MVCKWIEICELREYEKQGLISDKWKKEYCETEDNWKNCERFQMEEKGEPHANILPDKSKLEEVENKK